MSDHKELIAEAREYVDDVRDVAEATGESDEWPEIELIERLSTAIESLQPRTVTTREELDALPVGAVVLELDSTSAYQSEGRREWTGDGRWYDSGQIPLPATVLFTPEVTA